VRRYLQVCLLGATFAGTLAIRIQGIDRHFWLLGDQIRDWTIALGPFTSLPLVGPPTHIGGYTIGPAFYWILWLIRVSVGPWFQNLPHAGGIGQAALQSAADTLLLAAVARRTGSISIALAAVVLLATAGYDLCLSALVWNATMATALTKTATALALFEWGERSRTGLAVTAAVAWCAVQVHTGAIFMTLGIFAALLAGPIARRERARLLQTAAVIALVIAALQIPYAVHQARTGFTSSGMGGVAGSFTRILLGLDPPQLTSSWAGFFGAFTYIEVAPWIAPWSAWLLIGCGAVVAMRYRRDPVLLAVTLLPQAAALAGYSFYVGDYLDRYYYFSLMPAAVLTILLACTAMRAGAARQAMALALFVGAVAIAPSRIALGRTMHQLPEYGPLLDGSRAIAKVPKPMRGIRTEFSLPPSTDPTFLYTILGGRIDPRSPYVGVIKANGAVMFEGPAPP
jgi:hypothetical protein